MSPEVEESRSTTSLELQTECCMETNTEVFIELETVPLTEDFMQTEVLKGARDFGTKDFVVLKKKVFSFRYI